MAELFRVEPQTSTSSSGRSMPGKGARSTALIQVKMVALAPIPSAKVTTTVRVKPGRFSSVRRLYRKSCQKVSISRGLRSRRRRAPGPSTIIGANARHSQCRTSFNMYMTFGTCFPQPHHHKMGEMSPEARGLLRFAGFLIWSLAGLPLFVRLFQVPELLHQPRYWLWLSCFFVFGIAFGLTPWRNTEGSRSRRLPFASPPPPRSEERRVGEEGRS